MLLSDLRDLFESGVEAGALENLEQNVDAIGSTESIVPSARDDWYKDRQFNSPDVFNSVGGFMAHIDDQPVDSYFKISYFNDKGKEVTFVFSLMPAIENHLPVNNQGAKVPELKPGICINTKMKHRNIVVPGSTPVVQAIGPESTMMYLQGLFVGDEQVATTEYTLTPFFTDEMRTGNAFEIARTFNNEIVLPSVPVTIDINASSGKPIVVGIDGYSSLEKFIRIKVRGLIQSFRNCTSRENRSYYAMDVLLIDYLQRQRANPVTLEEAAAQNQEYAACALEYESYKKELAVYEATQQETESPTVRQQDIKAESEVGWFLRPIINPSSEGSSPEVTKTEKTQSQKPQPISDRCMQLLQSKNYPGLVEGSETGKAVTPKEPVK